MLNNIQLSIFFSCLILISGCKNNASISAADLYDNIAALEQTVDLESREIETDETLQFGQTVVEMGEIPLGESRELTLKALNRSDKPLVLLDAYTSCQCTQIAWSKEPIPAGEETVFSIRFRAEQPGAFFKKIAVRHSANPRSVTFAIQGIVVSD